LLAFYRRFALAIEELAKGFPFDRQSFCWVLLGRGWRLIEGESDTVQDHANDYQYQRY
jgi:hypothetical protein